MKMVLELDSTKEFLRVYKIHDDASVKKLNYKKNSDGTVEIETNHLGKYVVSYKEKEETSEIKQPTNEENVNQKEENKNNAFWIIASGIVASLEKNNYKTYKNVDTKKCLHFYFC